MPYNYRKTEEKKRNNSRNFHIVLSVQYWKRCLRGCDTLRRKISQVLRDPTIKRLRPSAFSQMTVQICRIKIFPTPMTSCQFARKEKKKNVGCVKWYFDIALLPALRKMLRIELVVDQRLAVCGICFGRTKQYTEKSHISQECLGDQR